MNKVYFADAKSMLEIPDKSINLIVTSPPYFNIKDYSKDGKQQNKHSRSIEGQMGDVDDFGRFIDGLLEIWKECQRVLAPNGKLIINTPLMPMLKKELSTHENRDIFDLNAAIQNSILTNISSIHLMDTYVWNRTNPSKKLMFGSYPYPSNFYAQNTVEFVTVYVKEGKSQTRPESIKSKSKLSQEEWVEYTKQVWNLPIPNKGDLAFGTHSALMPEEIVARCVKLYSFYGDVVLDPFTGSGTTLRVAKSLNRKFVGYEIMESYSEIIEKKLEGDYGVTPRRNLDSFRIKKSPLEQFHDLNGVVKSDAIKFIERIPDNSVDLICVDPPYNMRKDVWDTFSSEQEFLKFSKKWIKAAVTKLRPGGSFYVFNTPENSAKFLIYLEQEGLEFQNWITWDKRDGFAAPKSKFVPGAEAILFFTKPGSQHTFNFEEVRIPYDSTSRINAAKSKGILKNGKRWFPNENGKLCNDVWHIPSERHANKVKGKLKTAEHPTMKPIELIERIIRASSNEGDVVLDFFVGSGTTAVASKNLGRNYLACDSNANYVKLAKKRLAQDGV
jgi:DNA modification methylase